MSELPKVLTVGVDGRPYSVILKKAQRPGHWALVPPREFFVFAGVVALSPNNDELRPDGGKNLWTSLLTTGASGGVSSIADANAMLKSLGSDVRLNKGADPELVGHFPHYPDDDPPFAETFADGSPAIPHKLFPIIPTLSGVAPLVLPTDCGKAACKVLGTEQKNTKFVVADGREFPLQNESPQETVPFVLTHLLLPGDAPGLGGNFKANKPTYQKALNTYFDMSADDKRAFDKKHGINLYARPAAGEAFVIVNMNMERVNDRSKVKSAPFFHHWGAVLMVSGPIQITLENQDGKPPTGWNFAMYGNVRLPKGDVRGAGAETFHGIHSNEGSFHEFAFTMVAKP
jgi:hypothetical protein